jgi:hypothetical protein
MKGFRTIAVGLFMAIGVPALTYLSGIDWTQYVPAQYAPVIAGTIMVVMRIITNTNVGAKS